MHSILAIDTSTPQGSVGFLSPGAKKSFRSGDEGETYSSRLFRWLEQIEEEIGHGDGFKNLTAVVVTSGPGTFTGLRVGIAAAKGIALSANALLFGFPTLEVMAKAFSQDRRNCYFQPLINAGRGEIYTARFSSTDGKITRASDDAIIKPEAISVMNENTPEYLIGPGTSLLTEDIRERLSRNAIIDDSFLNLSDALLSQASEKLAAGASGESDFLEINYIRKATS